MSERILIAGGAGFIGRHLCRYLANQGHDITVVDNFCTSSPDVSDLTTLGVKVIECDVQETPRGLYSAIFHLASPASPLHYKTMPLETMWANALGTRRLLDIATTTDARFLLASTSEIYGDPLEHPQHESYFGNVNSVGVRACYDESKRFAEALTINYLDQYGPDARIVRIFNTYGPGMELADGRAIPEFIASALNNRPLTINGDGSQTRSFCYVDDLVRGLVEIGMNDGLSGSILNLGNPAETTVLAVARRIVAETRSASEIVFTHASPDDPQRRCPDVSRVHELLGWEPVIGLDVGLPRTIADIRSRIAEYTTEAAD